MEKDTGTTDRESNRGRSNEEFGSGQNTPGRSTTGVDLRHPPKGIENLPDTEKRFMAGLVREAIVQGLGECQRTSGREGYHRENVQFADRWIASNVPFLSGVIGDAGPGPSSDR